MRHFPLRRLIPLIIFLLGVGVIHGQSSTPEPSEKWWWAWRAADHSVIAFDTAGDTHVIATPDSASRFSRISDDTAIAVLQTGDVYALYKLTSQSVVQLSLTFEGVFNPEHFLEKFHLLAVHWPYAVVDGPTEAPLWLINFLTNTIELLDKPLNDSTSGCSYDLSGVLVGLAGCLDFSADGHYLRYIADLTSDHSGKEIALRERDLTTNVERNFYTPPSVLDGNPIQAGCSPSVYGDYWLCGAYSQNDTYTLKAVWLVDTHGNTRTLVEQTLDSLTLLIFFSGDSLVVQKGDCSQDCSIDVYTQAGSFLQTFEVPSGKFPYAQILPIPLKNGSLFLEVSDGNNYLLSPTEQLQKLGATYCCEVIDTLSPDLHWIILDTKQGTTIWDLETNQPRFILPVPVFPAFLYTDLGFLVWDRLEDQSKSRTRWVYFNGESQLQKILIDTNGKFVDMLPDKTLLYEQAQSNKTLAAGIYLYNADTEIYSSLVPGATFQFGY